MIKKTPKEADQNSRPLIEPTWLRVLLFIIGFMITTIVMQLAGIYLAGIIHQHPFNEIWSGLAAQDSGGPAIIEYMVIIQGTLLLGTLLIVWIFRRFIDKRSFYSLGFQLHSYQKDAMLGVGTGIILIGIGFLTLHFSGFLKVSAIHPDVQLLLLSLIFYSMVALNEEVMLRGYILKNLLTGYHPYTALGVSAAIFALMHGINPNVTLLGLVNIMLAGVLFGIYYIHTQNLWFPIMLHFSWNFCQGPIFGFEVSGMNTESLIQQQITGPDLITGGAFGFEGSIILTVLLIPLIFGIHHRYGEKFVPAE